MEMAQSFKQQYEDPQPQVKGNQPPIEVGFQNLQKALDNLVGHISTLEAKVAPVLRGIPDHPTAVHEPQDAYGTSSISGLIASLTDQVQNSYRRIALLVDRVEL